MKFGDNLKKIRTLKKVSQEELAEKLKESKQTISKWEKGDAYPTKNDLQKICKILDCEMDDLVNDNIPDRESFKEEVKTKVVSLKNEEQKKIKTLSKIIAVIAKICRICCYIAIPFVCLILIAIPYLISNDKYKIAYDDDQAVIKVGSVISVDANDELVTIFENNSTAKIIGYLETGFVVFLVTIIVVSILLKNLENLFDNINKEKTPFTSENVGLIRKIAWKMIIIIILSNISTFVFELLVSSDLNINIDFVDVVEILFLFSLAYIFEYGRLLGLETKGQMYGDNE